MVLASIAVFAAACTSEADSSGIAVTVTDSAGTTVTEYATEASVLTQEHTWREVVRIGTVDGPTETRLSNIRAGKILGDGRFVIGEMDGEVIHQFTAAGEWLGTYGGRGAGPTEFEELYDVLQCGATSFAGLGVGDKYVEFSIGGSHVRTDRVVLPGNRSAYQVACSEPGSLAAIEWGATPPSNSTDVTSPTGTVLMSDGFNESWVDLADWTITDRISVGSGSGPHPVGRNLKMAFADESLIVSNGESFGYTIYADGAGPAEFVRVDVAPPDQDSIIEEIVASFLSRVPESRYPAIRRTYADLPRLPAAAFFRDLVTSPSSVLLQQISSSASQEGAWFEFALDRGPKGWLDLPAGSRLLDVRNDLVLVVQTDDLGVQYVVLYARTPAID